MKIILIEDARTALSLYLVLLFPVVLIYGKLRLLNEDFNERIYRLNDRKYSSLLVFSLTTNLASFPAENGHFFRVKATEPSDATAKCQ